MPQGGAARKSDTQPSDSNRSSSNSVKRQRFSTPKAANDNTKPSAAPGAKTLRGTGPKVVKLTPKPTGTASPAVIKQSKSQKKSRSVGPQAIARPVAQSQLAAQLDTEQQQARRSSATGSSQTREQMLADSSDTAGTVLPGQFDPQQSAGAYAPEASTPPGSAAEPPDIDIERGGGDVQSDLERQRAMQLQQGQMAAARQHAGTAAASAGLPAIAGTTIPSVADTEPTEVQATSEDQPVQATTAGRSVFQAGQEPTGKGASQIQAAQSIASAVGMERTAKAAGVAQSAIGNAQAAKKAAQSLKTFWNIVKAGELAAGMSVVSIIVLIVTANLQMINKYTFKNKLVPETYLVEDATIICADCALCGSSCISFLAMPFVFIPLIGGVILLGSIIGLDQLDVIDIGAMFTAVF